MRPEVGVVVVAAICTSAGALGWRLAESKVFTRMLAAARGAARGAGDGPSSAAAILPGRGSASLGWVRAAVVAGTTGAVAGALTTGPGRHFFEAAWLVPWAAMVALVATTDLLERVVPTPAVRAASAVTVGLIALGCATSGDWLPLLRGLGSSAVVWVLLASWSLLSPRTLGFGDVRAAFLVALGAGAVSPAATLAGLAGAHLGAAAWSRFRARLGGRRWEEGVALGPFLALAGIVVVVASAS